MYIYICKSIYTYVYMYSEQNNLNTYIWCPTSEDPRDCSINWPILSFGISSFLAFSPMRATINQISCHSVSQDFDFVSWLNFIFGTWDWDRVKWMVSISNTHTHTHTIKQIYLHTRTCVVIYLCNYVGGRTLMSKQNMLSEIEFWCNYQYEQSMFSEYEKSDM